MTEETTKGEQPSITDPATDFTKWLYVVGVAVVVVGMLPVLLFWLGDRGWGVVSISTDVLGRAGTFGDSFGFINAIVSGLAFAAVVLTLWMQRGTLQMQSEAITLQSTAIIMQKEELELQRKELEMTRGELKRSADAQQNSERMLFKTAYLKAIQTWRETGQALLDDAENMDDRFVRGSLMVAEANDALINVLTEMESDLAQTLPQSASKQVNHRLAAAKDLWYALQCYEKQPLIQDADDKNGVTDLNKEHVNMLYTAFTHAVTPDMLRQSERQLVNEIYSHLNSFNSSVPNIDHMSIQSSHLKHKLCQLTVCLASH